MPTTANAGPRIFDAVAKALFPAIPTFLPIEVPIIPLSVKEAAVDIEAVDSLRRASTDYTTATPEPAILFPTARLV
jgi:hypothetical protein